MPSDPAETHTLFKSVMKECLKAEVCRLVHDNLSDVLAELLAELLAEIRGGGTEDSPRTDEDTPDADRSLETPSIPTVVIPSPVRHVAASPVCEGYVCGCLHTSLSASEVALDFDGVDLVNSFTIHDHKAMCKLSDTIIVTSAAEVPSVYACHEILDVVYFDKKFEWEAINLRTWCPWSSALSHMRDHLKRRNTNFLTTLLEPHNRSVSVTDIHEYLCRLPSDVQTSLFRDLSRPVQKTRLVLSHPNAPEEPCRYRQEEDIVSILEHHCIPVIKGEVQGYRLRYALGSADLNVATEQLIPAKFENSEFSKIVTADNVEWVYGKQKIGETKK
jgi:hypothetical protein